MVAALAFAALLAAGSTTFDGGRVFTLFFRR